jgi:hypothetical protein
MVTKTENSVRIGYRIPIIEHLIIHFTEWGYNLLNTIKYTLFGKETTPRENFKTSPHILFDLSKEEFYVLGYNSV